MPTRAPVCVACLALALAAGAQELPLRVPGKPVAATAKAHPAQSGFRDPAYPAALTHAVRLPPPASLPSARPEGELKRARIGTRREVASAAAGPIPLQWLATPGGGMAARLQVASGDARAMRLGLRVRSLPEGAELRVAGLDGGRTAAPVEARRVREAMRAQGVFWTPATEGEAQSIELWLPPGADASVVRIEIDAVSHLDRAASSRFKSAGLGAAQACHQNVACVARDDPAVAQAARAVARLLYTENGDSYLCTGTLINDGDPASQVPYLYTAAHCIDSQAAAASLETFWFFEAPDCASSAPAAYRQLSGGADLLYASETTDAAILRLRDPAPEGAWFAGWDATPITAGQALVGLHHPAGDLKKASLGVSLDLSSNLIASWQRGSTEGGSSGSGVFTAWNGEYVLRGGLRGGSAACSNSGRVGDPLNRDYYSRLDLEAGALRKTLALPGPAPRAEGLWWNPAEPGWGLAIANAAPGRAFVTWYTYDAEGRATWLAMPDAAWTTGDSLEGALYRATGSEAGQPYDASRFTMAPVGTARIEFAAGAATFNATLDGRAIAAPIRRLVP